MKRLVGAEGFEPWTGNDCLLFVCLSIPAVSFYRRQIHLNDVSDPRYKNPNTEMCWVTLMLLQRFFIYIYIYIYKQFLWAR